MSATSPARGRALVVDDEKLIRWCLAETLKCDDLDVDEAADAASALRAAEEAVRPYDVILLDVRLPDADGLSIMERLHAMMPDASIIVMSAHAPVDLLDRALQLGAFSVLAKPFPLRVMEAHVARALSGGPRPALQPAS